MTENKDTYNVYFNCLNCDEPQKHLIPKGTRIDDVDLDKLPLCDNCGCIDWDR